jgi:hypothetical protein
MSEQYGIRMNHCSPFIYKANAYELLPSSSSMCQFYVMQWGTNKVPTLYHKRLGNQNPPGEGKRPPLSLSPQLSSQLHVIIEQSHLLSWLECRHANIRTSIATEGISKTAVSTRSNLSLHGEVHFGQVILSKLQSLELGIGQLSSCCVLCCEFFSQST